MNLTVSSPAPGTARAQAPESGLNGLIRRMPKAELHVHIEGTLEPALLFEMARRNRVALQYPSVAALRAAYDFSDLQSFLDVYYAGMAVLREERDFYDLAMAYFRHAAADNVVRVELFFDPQAHAANGVDIGRVIRGLSQASAEARTTMGISSGMIMCFLRHLSEDDALRTLEAALPYRDQLLGVGLDSSERGNPPEKFATVFRRCADLGLRRVAHAGEEGPADYIRSALDVLGVERIDHGIACLSDPALMRRLALERIPLTVCPLSNLRLCVVESLQQHALPALLEAGVCATINSDDPSYFGGYINDNFIDSFAAMPSLGAPHAYQLARNSLDASFATEVEKVRWIHQLDQVFAS